MKYIEADDFSDLAAGRGRLITASDTFAFRCHPGVSCFNRCCRNLNLFLNPYDVLRLKNRLELSSAAFIEAHTDIVLRPGQCFPDVLLRMADNAEKTCPFLTDAGCRVYPDRPQTCRSFPVEHGLYYDAEKNRTQPVHFFRPPDFCQGRFENTLWTLESWAADQEAGVYNRMTAEWAELLRRLQLNPFGPEGPEGQKGKMAFMASYNLDEFREFVFGSSFLKRYKLKSSLRMKIKTDDTALLKLGMAWIRMFLCGEATAEISLKK